MAKGKKDTAKEKKAPLTNKQRAFIEYYLVSWNATDAARQAGYPAKSARQMGSENLSKPDIRAIIEERLKTMSMGSDEVLARLTDHARSDIGDFLNPLGGFDLQAARAAGKLHLIKKFKRTVRIERPKDADPIEIVTIEVELHDPQAALVHLGRHHKLFVERTELTGKDGGPVEVKDIDAMRDRRWKSAQDAMKAALTGEGTEQTSE